MADGANMQGATVKRGPGRPPKPDHELKNPRRPRKGEGPKSAQSARMAEIKAAAQKARELFPGALQYDAPLALGMDEIAIKAACQKLAGAGMTRHDISSLLGIGAARLAKNGDLDQDYQAGVASAFARVMSKAYGVAVNPEHPHYPSVMKYWVSRNDRLHGRMPLDPDRGASRPLEDDPEAEAMDLLVSDVVIKQRLQALASGFRQIARRDSSDNLDDPDLAPIAPQSGPLAPVEHEGSPNHPDPRGRGAGGVPVAHAPTATGPQRKDVGPISTYPARFSGGSNV